MYPFPFSHLIRSCSLKGTRPPESPTLIVYGSKSQACTCVLVLLQFLSQYARAPSLYGEHVLSEFAFT